MAPRFAAPPSGPAPWIDVERGAAWCYARASRSGGAMSHGAYVEIEALGPQRPHQRAAFWLLEACARWSSRASADEPVVLYAEPAQGDLIARAGLLIPVAGAFEALAHEAGEHWFVLPGATPDDPSRARVHLSIYADAGEHHGLPLDHVQLWCPRSGPIPSGIQPSEARLLHTPTGTAARSALERSQLKNRQLALRALASKLGGAAPAGRAPVRSWDLVAAPGASL